MKILPPEQKLPEKANLEIVRLTTTCWSDQRGIYIKKSITQQKRKSTGYQCIYEDTMNIGADEVIHSIINLNECADGLYQVKTVNHVYDWETGYIESYDYKLIPYESEKC